MPSKYFPKKRMIKKLYTISEIATALGVSANSVQYWYDNGTIPEPFGIYSLENRRVWTSEQVAEAKIKYQAAIADKGPNRGGKPRIKTKYDPEVIEEPEETELVDEVEDTFRRCPEPGCGQIIFNQETHNRFSHFGKNRKLEVTGAKK